MRILDQVRARHKFAVIGYVLMPEHVHLLMSEPVQGDPSNVVQVLKQNPVKRKLVEHPKDWPWSSWSFYAKGEEGLLRIDVLRPKPGGS